MHDYFSDKDQELLTEMWDLFFENIEPMITRLQRSPSSTICCVDRPGTARSTGAGTWPSRCCSSDMKGSTRTFG